MPDHWFDSFLDRIDSKSSGEVMTAINRLAAELHRSIASIAIIHQHYPTAHLNRKRKLAEDALAALRDLAKSMED